MRSLVSILIGAHNYVRFIEQAIVSALEQDRPEPSKEKFDNMYQLSFLHLERWDLAKRGEFSEVLCLTVERGKTDMERLAGAGFGWPKYLA